MLTIQPKFTQNVQFSKANPSFRSADDSIIPSDSYYKSQTNYYENQIKELDDLIDNEHTPNTFKKVLKGFRVASEGLLEGCAVAWGASKGAKVIKSSTMKGFNSKFAQKSIEILKPVVEGFKTTGSEIIKAISGKFAEFKTSKFATNIAENFTKLTEILENNKIGKYVVAGFKAIANGFNWIGSKIAQGTGVLKAKAKSVDGSQLYDKVANVTSKTLGTGAGVAGAYNAAIKPNSTEDDGKIYNQRQNYDDDYDYVDDVEDDFDYSELEDVENDIEEGV